jgi:predicted alpha/beta hydrolase family esterase
MTRPSILMLPGWTNSGPDHWQSVWERAHPEYRRIEQENWDTPTRDDWLPTIGRAITEAAPPIVLVAQSLGCIAAVEWANRADPSARARVAGAFLVAPADVERKGAGRIVRQWRPISMNRLPFPSMVVASRTDPFAAFARSQQFAAAWGSEFIDIGDAGHINTASGYGPWPEGHKLLLEFIARLT